MEDKETPLPFHFLDTLETRGYIKFIFFKKKFVKRDLRLKNYIFIKKQNLKKNFDLKSNFIK